MDGFQETDELASAVKRAAQHEEKASDRMTRYQQRMLELEIQSLQEAMRLYDPIHIEEQNRLLRAQLRRLHEENFVLSRQSKEATDHMRSEMVRVRNMLEDEFRARLHEAEGRVKQTVFHDLSAAMADATAQRDGLFAALQSLEGGITVVSEKYRLSQESRTQLKIDGDILAGVYEEQTVMLVRMRQQLAESAAYARVLERDIAARGDARHGSTGATGSGGNPSMTRGGDAARPTGHPGQSTAGEPVDSPRVSRMAALAAEAAQWKAEVGAGAAREVGLRSQLTAWRTKALVLEDTVARAARLGSDHPGDSESDFLLSIWHRKHGGYPGPTGMWGGCAHASTQTDTSAIAAAGSSRPVSASFGERVVSEMMASRPGAHGAAFSQSWLPLKMRRPTSARLAGWRTHDRPSSAYLGPPSPRGGGGSPPRAEWPPAARYSHGYGYSSPRGNEPVAGLIPRRPATARGVRVATPTDDPRQPEWGGGGTPTLPRPHVRPATAGPLRRPPHALAFDERMEAISRLYSGRGD